MGPVHSIGIGGARVTLDVSLGLGYERDVERGVLRQLTPAESRLLLLDWTRRRLPTPSPQALWVVEAAALAASASERHWREWASADLHAALAALMHSPIGWSDAGRDLLLDALESAEVDPAAVEEGTLRAILRELEAAVAANWDCGIESAPAPETVSGCTEVEWDRVLPATVDLGEVALRFRILGTVWTASLAQPRRRREGEAERLWARLVDDSSGLIYDEVEMGAAGGVYGARGYVPPSARRSQTRIDVTAYPALSARAGEERRHVLLEQKWFRSLFFGRQGSRGPVWADWGETYRSRLGLEQMMSGDYWARTFLAEWHVRPTDLASGSRPFLSPRPTTPPPSVT